MWYQKNLNISQSAFLFSIITHALLLSILLQSEHSNKLEPPNEMKIILIPVNLSSKNSEKKIISSTTQNTTARTETKRSYSSDAPSAAQDNIPDFFELESKNSLINQNYDPLADARYKAEKAIADAKIVADEHSKNLEKIDDNSIHQLKNAINNNNDLNNNNINNLYKVEILSNAIKNQNYKNIIFQASTYQPNLENKEKIDTLKEKVKLLIEQEVLKKLIAAEISIQFTIDPEKLLIMVEVFSASNESKTYLEQLLHQLNFDLILINSNLNEKPYSFSLNLKNE